MTFEDACDLEPQLDRLKSLAKGIRNPGSNYCKRRTWWVLFEAQLGRYVGPEARCEALQTPAAAAVARNTLRALLPRCKSCECEGEA